MKRPLLLADLLRDRTLVLDFGLIALASVLFLLPLLTNDWVETHETDQYLMRLFALDASVRGGVFDLRWSSIMYQGYGYPFFNFYAPLIFILAELFHLVGFSLVGAMKATLLAATVMQGVFVYLFVERLWGRVGGLVASLVYLFAPYHFFNVYRRGALAEYLAGCLLPLVLYCYARYLPTGRARWFLAASLSFALLVLSHNISAMFFTGVLVLYLAYSVIRQRPRRAVVLLTGLSVCCGLLMTCYFWLPALLDRPLVRQEILLTGWFDYRKHFVDIGQLISGAMRTTGKLPTSRLTIGALPIALTALAGIHLLGSRGRHRADFVLFAVLGGVTVFFMTNASAALWELLPLLPFCQFPWRLLMVASWCFAVTAGAIARFYPTSTSRGRLIVSLGLCAAVGLLQAWDLASFKPRPVDRSRFSVDHFLSQKITTNFDEFVPRTSKKKPPARTRDFVITAGNGKVVDQQRRINWLSARLRNPSPTTLRVSAFYYPGWEVSVDGQLVEIWPDEFGLITLRVPAGEHRVEATFVGSRLHRTSDWASRAGLVLLLGVFFVLRRRQRRGASIG